MDIGLALFTTEQYVPKGLGAGAPSEKASKVIGSPVVASVPSWAVGNAPVKRNVSVRVKLLLKGVPVIELVD